MYTYIHAYNHRVYWLCDVSVDSLMRAVTSMKLSPSGRFGLVGYGVRSDGNVIHHSNQKVACEVLNLVAIDMSTSCILTDDIDEVWYNMI